MKRLFLVTLTFVLLVGFSVPATAASKAEAKMLKMEKKIEKILGTNTNWKATAFKNLHLGMPCKEVKKHFRGLKCNPRKKYDFPKVSGKLFGTVKEYKFTFKTGALQSATIVFGSRLTDSKRFAQALLNVAQRKWGKLSPEKLAKKTKVWVNGDYDTVSLSYVGTNWTLAIRMPKRDTGDVKSGSMNKAQIEAALTKLLGSPKSWLTPSSSKFRKGSTCNQVKAVYKFMKGCNPSKNWSFGSVTIKNHDLVHALKFSFKKGQLQNITYVFHRQVPRDLFKEVSLKLFEAKWGKVKADKRNKDLITVYKNNFGIAQRNFVLDHWEIKHDYPK